MKKIIAIVVSLLLLSSVAYAIDEKTSALMMKKKSASLTCNTTTPWAQGSNTRNDSWNNNTTKAAQKLKITASIQICRIAVYITASGSTSYQLWSDIDRAGTQYGSAMSATATSGYEWKTIFNNSGSPITVPGDAFLHFMQGDGSAEWGANSSSTSYQDSVYDLYWAGSKQTGDFMFRIYTMQ